MPLSSGSSAALLFLLCADVLAQTTRQTAAACSNLNNTSASAAYRGQSANTLLGNVSKLPVRSLFYPGATTRIFVRYMPWFGNSRHRDVGLKELALTRLLPIPWSHRLLTACSAREPARSVLHRTASVVPHPRTACKVGNTSERNTLLIWAGVNRLRRSNHHVNTEKKAALRYRMNRSTGTSESAFLNSWISALLSQRMISSNISSRRCRNTGHPSVCSSAW